MEFHQHRKAGITRLSFFGSAEDKQAGLWWETKFLEESHSNSPSIFSLALYHHPIISFTLCTFFCN